MKNNTFLKHIITLSTLLLVGIIICFSFINTNSNIENSIYNENIKDCIETEIQADDSVESNEIITNTKVNATDSIYSKDNNKLNKSSYTFISGQQSIFHYNNSGIISYLEINPTLINLYQLTIKQTIGNTTITIEKDELDSIAYKEYNELSPITYSLYFTRSATYQVFYMSQVGGTIFESICEFSSEIVPSEVSKISTDSSNKLIKNINSNYWFYQAGTVELNYNSDLFNATFNGSSIDENDKEIIIPNDTYGMTTLSFISKSGYASRTINIYIDTSILNFTYTKSPTGTYNTVTEKTFSVFNCDTIVTISVSNNTLDMDGNYLLDSEKSELLELYDFTANEKIVDTLNSNITDGNIIKGEKIIENDIVTHIVLVLPNCNHSIFSVNATTKANSLLYSEKSSITKLKIITEVPMSLGSKRDISIYLQQSSSVPDYLTDCISGKLPSGTKIYNSLSTVLRIVPNITTGMQFSINNGLTYTIFNASNTEFNNGTILLQNKNNTNMTELDFDSYYIFKLEFISMNTDQSDLFTNYFDYSKLGTTHKLNVSNPTNGKIYNDSQCVPTFMEIDYNGTIYSNFDSFVDGDIYEFTLPGKYIINMFTFPNSNYAYEYKRILESGISSSLTQKFYKSVEFTVEGASLSAVDDDNNTIINYQYTNKPVKVTANKLNTQSLKIYYNNIENTTQSIDSLFSIPGTWKIVIFNTNGVAIKIFEFTILSNYYQGFSITPKEDYSSLKVEKQLTKTPETYETINSNYAYHLTDEYYYKLSIAQENSLIYKVSDTDKQTNATTKYEFFVNIVKSKFSINFETGTSGSRITEKVVITSVSGVNLQKLEVIKNNSVINTLNAVQLANFDKIDNMYTSYADNATYIIRLTDVYGNTYEAQITKYYKANVSLILLFVVIGSAIIFIIIMFIRGRKNIRVK